MELGWWSSHEAVDILGVLGECNWGWLVRSMSSTLHHRAFNKWQHFCRQAQIRKPLDLGRRVSIVLECLQVEWCMPKAQLLFGVYKLRWGCWIVSLIFVFDSGQVWFYERSVFVEPVQEVFSASILILPEHIIALLGLTQSIPLQ